MTEYAPADWRAAGACVSADPDLFFPVSPNGQAARQAARALRICAICPVRRECLEFALSINEMEGIWGGTTPEERIRSRREATARRRRERRQEPARRVA
jgi:WhiB family transcriptional regulator, redox-sensing transcriptional regulator